MSRSGRPARSGRISKTSRLLSNLRYLLSLERLGVAKLFVAWLFNLAYSVALVFASTWAVVAVAPEAAGAGVAEVMAYLNGCNLPRVRRRRPRVRRPCSAGPLPVGRARRGARGGVLVGVQVRKLWAAAEWGGATSSLSIPVTHPPSPSPSRSIALLHAMAQRVSGGPQQQFRDGREGQVCRGG